MAGIVLDSSVVLALFDPHDSHHVRAVAALRARRAKAASFSVPALVLAEVLVGAARRGEVERDERHNQIVAAFGPIRVIDEAVARRAATLRARHPSVRLPDALVMAVGVVDDAAEILTCDKAWSRYDSRVVVIGRRR